MKCNGDWTQRLCGWDVVCEFNTTIHIRSGFSQPCVMELRRYGGEVEDSWSTVAGVTTKVCGLNQLSSECHRITTINDDSRERIGLLKVGDTHHQYVMRTGRSKIEWIGTLND